MQLADHIRKARQIQNKFSHPSCAAVIVAAGSSARMGGTDKILAELGGLPVLSRTLRVFDDHDMIDTIIVVAREEQMPKISRVCSPYHKVRIVVPGGNSRQESVMHGLEAVPEETELVAVHDGARPLVSPEVITKVILKAAKFGAAAPAIPVKDTIKVSKTGGVDETPDRKTLFAVQTPQVFDTALLASLLPVIWGVSLLIGGFGKIQFAADLRRFGDRRWWTLLLGALQNAKQKGLTLTDDCSAVEALGMTVLLTDGSEENIKITTPLDLEIAELILKRREET